jgi:Raf kinase inhibitor-like YbhB/YbcL family protein
MRHGVGLGVLALLAIAAGAPRCAAADALTLTSDAFANGAAIPTRHTCEGEDVSPALAWSGAPPATKSFVVIVDDPDAPDPAAPKGTWVHWVLYEVPASAHALPAAAARASLPPGTREGLNDWNATGWRGPCPPVGRHRYVFKLYALDAVLGDVAHPTKAAVEQAMRGHVLAEAQLTGVYQKQRGGA